MRSPSIEKRIRILLFAAAAGCGLLFFAACLFATGKISFAWIFVPFFLLITCGVAWWLWISLAFKKAKRAMENFSSGYSLKKFVDEKNSVCRELDAVQKKVEELLDIGKMASISKRQAQFLALQNQINPHFLYNTLEGIRSEAMTAGLESVASMAEAMSRFFRYTISGSENLVTLGMELENTENYFFIQKYRFGPRLHLKIQIDDDDRERALKCRFPKLTLQPIVENAILHGLECKRGEGQVTISVLTTDTRLLVTIGDDGVGMNEATFSKIQKRLTFRSLDYVNDVPSDEKHAGIALENVNNRIKILFGEEYGLTVESTQGVGTDFHISLPLKVEDDVV